MTTAEQLRELARCIDDGGEFRGPGDLAVKWLAINERDALLALAEAVEALELVRLVTVGQSIATRALVDHVAKISTDALARVAGMLEGGEA